jgi:hypothetical protein
MALIGRRDRIGRAFFSKLLPLDNFRVSGGRIAFDDLGVHYGFAPPRSYRFQWSRFDNVTRHKEPLPGADGAAIPARVQDSPAGAYFAADITSDDPRKSVTAYLRKTNGGFEVVGIERTW